MIKTLNKDNLFLQPSLVNFAFKCMNKLFSTKNKLPSKYSL